MTMTILVPQAGMTAQGMCKRCAGLIPAHFLTCPVLRLPLGYRLGFVFLTRREDNATRTEQQTGSPER